MNILKIMAILLAVVAVASAAGCFEKAQVAGNETRKASEQVTTAAVPATSVAKSAPSVTPLAKENMDLTSSTVVDVVCKMKIDKRTAEVTSEYKGTTYYFCALSCKKEFDENPEKYINSETTENVIQEASEQLMSATTGSTDSASSSVVDVICGMTIDKGTAEFTSEYKGKTYYFCVLSCKEEFDANPEIYISSETTEDETSEVSEQVTSVATNSASSTASTVVDVVCKMEIDRRTAEFTGEYKGTTYYFCSASCKEKFNVNPEYYINSETTENNSEITENETQEASEQVTSSATNSTDSALSTVVDVICGMTVDKRTAEFTGEYKGTIYYFCALSCKKEFDANPKRYISSETTENETQKNCKPTENEIQEASEKETSASANGTASASSTIVDVVCKMKIDKRTAKFTGEYKGITYYFCALSCKNEFDANPEKYISSETTENETRNNPETKENSSNTTEKSSNTTENKTQEASEQATSVVTNSTDSTASTVVTENETEEASEQVTPETTNNTDSASSTVVDVVCKMKIDRRTVEFKSEYKGTTCYFCALSCKEEFDSNPEKYISSETT